MKDRGIYGRWLLLMGINQGTCYFGQTIGNSPEMMPMDSTLNKDVNDSVRYHISLTFHLPKDDEIKFSMSTPKRGSQAYHRVWEEVPSSQQIIEDTDWFLIAIKAISDHDGKAVAGLGSQKGHRNAKTKSLKKRGGKRVKKEFKYKRFVHKDAGRCREICIETSMKKHANTPKEEPELKKEEGVAAVDRKTVQNENTLAGFQMVEIISLRPYVE